MRFKAFVDFQEVAIFELPVVHLFTAPQSLAVNLARWAGIFAKWKRHTQSSFFIAGWTAEISALAFGIWFPHSQFWRQCSPSLMEIPINQQQVIVAEHGAIF